VLAVAAFVAFWVLVALGLTFLAVRGGPGARPHADPGRRGTRVAITLFVVTAAVFGVALPLLLLTGNHSNASAQVSGYKLTDAEKSGRELFGEHCGVCHTLIAANAVGKVGPNLDLLKPGESIILHTIANGCLPNPPANSQAICLGQGVMPADVVQGAQADEVAEFVARVTGGAVSTSSSSASSSSGSTASSSSASATSTSSATTSASSSAAAAPSGQGQTLHLAAATTGMLMYDTKTLTAKAGKVTIDFTNASPVPHNVTVQSGTTGPTIAATPTFSGGTKSISMTLKPGTYTYYCSVPGHRQAGMVGTLTVK
jgi:plastocyanin